MKKLLFTILIFLLTVTVPGNAQIFNNNETGTGKNTEIRSNFNENSEGRTDTEGFFRADNDYARPEVGDGIGETGEMPIGEGLFTLMFCNILWGAVKFLKRERNQINVKDNLKN